MELAGAVFLPAAGYRLGTDVGDMGSSGLYWSSTPNDEDYAYYVGFIGRYLNAAYSDYRGDGFSVRPVQD
jgi:hypothetical protein